jgi:threonyl-tRNA synthetase
VEGDYRNEKIGYKIREAQMQKVPYMLVIGDKEAQDGSLSIRTRTGEQLTMSVEEFLAKIQKEVDDKAI